MNAIPRILLAGALTIAPAGCAAPPAPAPAVSAATFGGTDRSWIEINLAMGEQLLPLLALVRDDSPLHDVSEQVRALTEAELAELRHLHAEAGLPAVNPHLGMPMPGMVQPSDVTEAARLHGAPFDALLLSRLRACLEQSRNLAESERAAGLEPRTIALAARISETRRAVLSRLPEN